MTAAESLNISGLVDIISEGLISYIAKYHPAVGSIMDIHHLN